MTEQLKNVKMTDLNVGEKYICYYQQRFHYTGCDIVKRINFIVKSIMIDEFSGTNLGLMMKELGIKNLTDLNENYNLKIDFMDLDSGDVIENMIYRFDNIWAIGSSAMRVQLFKEKTQEELYQEELDNNVQKAKRDNEIFTRRLVDLQQQIDNVLKMIEYNQKIIENGGKYPRLNEI